jgi:hypothetical protein
MRPAYLLFAQAAIGLPLPEFFQRCRMRFQEAWAQAFLHGAHRAGSTTTETGTMFCPMFRGPTIRVGIDVDRQQDLDNFIAGLDRPSFNFANIVDFAVDHPSTQSALIIDVAAGGTAKSLYSRVLMLQTAPFRTTGRSRAS